MCQLTSLLTEHFDFYIRQLKVGSPKDSTTNVGALVSKEHLAKVRFWKFIHKIRLYWCLLYHI